MAAEVARLAGHEVAVAPDGLSYVIVAVAGEGRPRTGVVRAEGAALWLDGPDGESRRLVGPLARPRLAGPGYKVWVLGTVEPDGSLRARRLGVLAPPARRRALSGAGAGAAGP